MPHQTTLLFLVALSVLGVMPAAAQTTATLTGRVLDPLGAALPAAAITLSNPLTGFEHTTTAQTDASFQITNIPPQTYRLAVTFPGFEPDVRDVNLRTSVPVVLDITLRVATQIDTVFVSAEAGNLVDSTLTGTRTAMSLGIIERMPTVTGSRGLESVLVSFPGFAQNANGAIHPRGAHNQMTFVVDGLPISDQLTGAFANSLDVAVVQTAELLTGNIPAEFGSKVSGVAILNSKSGRGTGRPLAGAVSLAAGGFDTVQGSVQLGGELGRVGYFGSATTMRTDRFLDQVSLDNLHNAGRFLRGFGRVDIPLNDRSQLRLHAMGGGSRFQLANLRSQARNGQDQRQHLSDASVWATFVQTLSGVSTLEATGGYRGTSAELLPSSGDTPVTAAQDRRLSTYTVSARYNH